MSDIRFNRWLHNSGTGGVTQDSSGNIGIGSSVPRTALDVVGVVSATSFTGSLTGNATGLSGTPNITVGTIGATSLNASGVVTATSFSGSGANLTGIAATTDVRTNSLVVSGITTVAAGSAAAPSITPTGDSNTGIFFPSADTIAFGEGGTEALRIDSSGRVTKPYTPHIFGSTTNTATVSNSFANSFTVVSSTELTFSTDRITVPVAGLYLITFCTISNTDSARKDAIIYINGTPRAQGLSEDTTTGYHYRGISMVMKLAANDYIQFYNQNWYQNTNTSFDAWKTASVTFLG